MKNSEIYNLVYKNNPNYNPPTPNKYEFIEEFILAGDHNSILDAGCGSGNALTYFLNKNLNVFGIEISKVCCDKYLSKLPHKNIGVVEYADDNIVYDCLYCFDVMEHIQYNEIDDFIIACLKLSKRCLFGIANHSDVQCGIELHPIKENVDWWYKILSSYFKSVKIINKEGRFFIFECKEKE
jgi:2-polyprenyl-3-methyl-5-hydroxy-6-metoxy-1,4-benzoquinol methylase